jgi:hypothetical protein
MEIPETPLADHFTTTMLVTGWIACHPKNRGDAGSRYHKDLTRLI